MTNDDATESRTPSQTAKPRSEPLALLYQGLLTAIVRVQSGKAALTDAAAFQERMGHVLDDVEREATKAGYRNQDIRDGHYAIVAFLDEAVQRSNDPNRHQWPSLQAKLYAQAVAGEGVYERLKTIRARRDSPDLADLLEVYYLCFLLGYEGRYALGGRAELDRLMEDLRDQIERIRGTQAALSPDGALPLDPGIASPASTPDGKWLMLALGGGAFACVSWIVLKLILSSYTQGASEMFAP
jgi:type VI secretion system protein ImpK